MIDYEQYCQIKDYHHRRQLTVPQIARELHLDERTVARWLAAEKFQPRQATPECDAGPCPIAAAGSRNTWSGSRNVARTPFANRWSPGFSWLSRGFKVQPPKGGTPTHSGPALTAQVEARGQDSRQPAPDPIGHGRWGHR